MSDLKLKISRFLPEAILPVKSTKEAACYDVFACIRPEDKVELFGGLNPSNHVNHEEFNPSETTNYHRFHQPCNVSSNYNDIPHYIIRSGENAIVTTGLNLRVPVGYEVQCRSRSGLAANYTISVLNSPGTIDSDYHGDSRKYELKIILMNHGKEPYVIKHGDKIAQISMHKLLEYDIEEDFNPAVPRKGNRTGGLGSTGV